MQIAHLNGWRAVEAVYRLGTIAAAADEIGITTAAVTARLRDLETRLGRKLFLREPKGLVPVQALNDLSGRLSTGMTALAEVQRGLGADRDSARVAISMTQTFAEIWFPRAMPSLFSRIAEIDLRLDTSWDTVDLSDGTFDFAIRFMDAPGPEFGAIPLIPSGVVPVCTPGFAERYALTPDTGSLASVPVFLFDVPTSDPAWCDWSGWCRRTGMTWQTDAALTVCSSGSGSRLALSGAGLVLGGLSEILYDVAAGRLVMPFGRGSVVPASFWHVLIWPATRPDNRTLRSFRRWIEEHSSVDRALMSETFGVDVTL